MTVDVFYINPSVDYDFYGKLAKRFYHTFEKHEPGCDNASLIELHPDETNGKDIGAYLKASRTCKADLMVCIGAHVRINQGGWLDRIVDAYQEGEHGLYGPFAASEPTPHIRTTCFWLNPRMLDGWGLPMETDQDRYDFERGPLSITNFFRLAGFPVYQVTKTRVLTYSEFEPYVEPEDALFLDKYTDQQDAARK